MVIVWSPAKSAPTAHANELRRQKPINLAVQAFDPPTFSMTTGTLDGEYQNTDTSAEMEHIHMWLIVTFTFAICQIDASPPCSTVHWTAMVTNPTNVRLLSAPLRLTRCSSSRKS
jgi:hypothetical protein